MGFNSQELAALAAAGASGSNPYVEANQQERIAKLKTLLEGQTTDANIAKAKSMLQSGDLPDGSGLGLTGSGGVAVTKGWNPMATQQQGAHQAQSFLKTAQGAYKGINDQLDASKATLDALNMGNAAGDNLALVNEGKLAAGNSRALGHILSIMGGDPTMASDAQKAMNWIQNTPNVSKMQPGQRDALRETVFARLPQLQQQHQQATQQLMQQGAVVAPQADTPSLVNSFAQPLSQKLQGIAKEQQDYLGQRKQMEQAGNSAVSSPSTASANPSTLDRLKSFFTGGQPAQQQAPQAPKPQAFDPDSFLKGQ